MDPLFTLALAVALGWAWARSSVKVAAAGLAACVAYLALGTLQHGRAVAAQAAIARARGHVIERHEVMPGMANNVVWRALYRYRGRIYSDRVRVGWFSSPGFREGWSLPLAGPDELSAAEKVRNGPRDPLGRFTWFSDGWVTRSPADPSVLGDMRYSLSTAAFDPIWGIRFTAPGQPVDVEWVNRSRERSLDAGEMWREVTGQDERYRPIPTSAQP